MEAIALIQGINVVSNMTSPSLGHLRVPSENNINTYIIAEKDVTNKLENPDFRVTKRSEELVTIPRTAVTLPKILQPYPLIGA